MWRISMMVAIFSAVMLLQSASMAITVEEVDQARDGRPDVVIVETDWYRFEFLLNDNGSAGSMIYKPLDHQYRAENYYGTRLNMFRDQVRQAEPDPITGLTPRGSGVFQGLRAEYSIVDHTDDEIVIDFVVSYQATEEVPWMENIRNRRRLHLRNDTPAVLAVSTIYNDDEEERPITFDMAHGLGLGRVLSAVCLPTPDGKLAGRDVAEETGSTFAYAPDLSGSWAGGVNETGLGGAFSVDWRDVDSMHIDIFKTVGSCYHINMRRRAVPAGGSVSFEYSFMPFDGFGSLDGMTGDIVGGMLIGEEADMFENVSRNEVRPGATVPAKIFLASGRNRRADVRIRCERKEDGTLVLDEQREIDLETAKTLELETAIPLGEQGLYLFTVSVDDGDGGTLEMERAIEVGRTRLVYTATTPPGEKRGERDAGESVGPPTLNVQFRTIDREFVTERLPFLKNHSQGAVNAFFLTPVDQSLGHVREITQRGDFEYDYVAAGKIRIPRNELNFRDVGEFHRKFRAGDHDVLVTLAIHWNAGLKRGLSNEIFGRIEEGMGALLMVAPQWPEPGIEEILENAVEITEETWPLPSTAIRVPPVRRYQYGEGRIVIIDASYVYGRDGADAALGQWSRLISGGVIQDFPWRGFEYSYAWLGDLIRWAGGKESSLVITGASFEDGEVLVDIHNSGEAVAGSLSLVARNRRWETRAEGAVDLEIPAGASQVRAPLNAPLPAGHYAVEIQLRDAEDRVTAFGSAGFEQRTGASVSIDPDLAYRSIIDPEPLEISIVAQAPEVRLEAEIFDRFDRLVHRKELDVALENRRASVSVDLDEFLPMTIYHYVLARISAGGASIAESSSELIMLPARADYEDRFVLGIADSPERRALHLQATLATAREAGFTMHTHTHRLADNILYATGGTSAANNFVTPDVRYAEHRRDARLDGPNLIMHPPLLPTEESIERYRESWKQTTEALRGRGAFYIGVDDERRMSADFDFNPHTLDGFRKWLAGRYENIGALNAAWDSDFDDFAEVMPKTRTQVEDQDNIAPWLEFRMFIGHVIGEHYMKAPALWAAEIDSNLSVGEMGIYAPGPNWPVDWSEYGKYYRHTGRYDDTVGRLISSFGEGARHGRWQGYNMRSISPGRRTQLWRSLLEGGNFAWFWALVDNGFWNYGLNTSDQRLTAGYAALAADEIPDLTGGIDRLIIASNATHDAVAVGYSYPSVIANRRAVANNSRRVVEELGLQYNFVRMSDVADGILEREGYRALVLKFAECLAVEEVEGIRGFAEAGGTVIVSGLSGFRDERGTPFRGERPLDRLLGIDTRGAEQLARPLICEIGDRQARIHVAVTGIEVDGAEVVGRVDFEGEDTPVLTRRAVGQGEVWWLNSPISGHAATFTGGVAGEVEITLEGPEAVRLAHYNIFSEILNRRAGIQARSMILDEGQPLFDAKSYYFESPSERTVFFARYLDRDVPGELDVRTSFAGHVYDLRQNSYLGETVEGGVFRSEFPPGRVNIFAILDYRVAGVEAVLDRRAVEPGERITLSASVVAEPADPGADIHALRISLLDPEGNDLEAHRTVLLAENGRAELTTQIALNAAPGEYTFVAFDVTSGMEARTALTVGRDTIDRADLVQYGRLRQVHTRGYTAEDTLAAARYTYSNVAGMIGRPDDRALIEEDGAVLALGLFGLGRRVANIRTALPGEDISDEEIGRSVRRTYEHMSMTLDELVEANELDDPQRLALSFAAPILLSVNQAGLRDRLVNRGFSATMGYFGGYRHYGYGHYEIEHFRGLIENELSQEEQAALFDRPVETLLPPPTPLRDDIFYKDLLLTPDELNKSMHGPLDDARVSPEFAAFLRTREQLMGRIYRELKHYGDELLDDYIYGIFTYIDHSGPHVYSLYFSTSVEGIFQRGQGASYMLWEPICNTPFRGFARDEQDRPKELFLEAEVTGDAGYWNPYAISAAYGRMSNTSMHKYFAAACDPGLMVATLSPGTFAFRPIHKQIQNGDFSGARNFLMMHMAETWANRLGFRMDTSIPFEQYGDQHRFDAARQMNGFQARHEDLFVGARPYDRVAVWTSMQQYWINRYDTSLGTSRMLTDADIEHRIVLDQDITDNRLDGINCLVISNIRMVTDEQLAALNAFAQQEGNGIVALGRFGDRDEWDRDRNDAMELLGRDVPEGRIVHLDENVYPQLAHVGEYRIRDAGDDLAPLAQAVRRIHGDEFSYIGATPELIELHPLVIDEPGNVKNTKRVVVHALNYDIDPWTGAAGTSEPLSFRVLIPGDAVEITRALYYEPSQGALDQEGAALDVTLEKINGKSYASLTLPGFKLNAVLVVDVVTTP